MLFVKFLGLICIWYSVVHVETKILFILNNFIVYKLLIVNFIHDIHQLAKSHWLELIIGFLFFWGGGVFYTHFKL